MNSSFVTIQSKHLSANTISTHERKGKKIIKWLKINEPECFDDDGLVKMESIETKVLCNYIDQEAHKADGSMKSYSTPDGIYCALLAFYEKSKHPLPLDYKRELAQYAKGYKNQKADDRQAGILPTAGSDKLAIDDYRKLCMLAAKSAKIYVWCFLVLAWNCMTRLKDTGDIKYEHLRMVGDHILIVIPKHRGDPTGDVTPTGKAIYANPLVPQICPFLSLAVLVLSRSSYKENESVLLGKKCDEDINYWLKEVEKEGSLFNEAHLTSHCTRKGSASYVASLPGLAAVLALLARAGWKAPGVLPIYVSQENAGDETVNFDFYTIYQSHAL